MHSLHPNIQISSTNQLVTLIPGQGEGGNPLARGAAGETTPSPGCSCYRPAAVTSCRTPTSVHRGPCSPSSCKPHPLSTRAPTRRLLLLEGRQSTHARRFPTASHFAPIRDGVVDRELFDFHAPELERSCLSRRILTPEGRAPRWDVSEIFMTLAIPVEDHFRRWHHPGRCPGGDQQPPRPPGHFIPPAAWRPKQS